MITPLGGAIRKLQRLLPNFFRPDARIVAIAKKSWASTTHSGFRLRFIVEGPVGELNPVCTSLVEEDFDIPTFLVADVYPEPIRPRDGRARVQVEILLLSDPPDQ